LAAYLHTTGRQQPHRSGYQGAAAAPDLKLTTKQSDRARRLENERVRLFFDGQPIRFLGNVRYLQLLAILGAMSVGLITWILAKPPIWNVVLWWLSLVVCEILISVISVQFARRRPPESDLKYWAWTKTVLSFLDSAAWSLGPILLHVDGAPISVLAPVWGIACMTAAAVMAGAFYKPCLIAMMVGATVPACLWLASFGGGIELIAAICIGVSLPFMMMIGLLSVRKTEEVIEARLEIADLLEVQKEQTQQIRDAHDERNRFFSAASHDLRQPLHAMGFYNSLLPRATVETERSEILGRISECASSLDRQFNAIIGVAQTDRAVEQAEIGASPLQEVFDRVIANVQAEATMKSLQLRLVPSSLWVRVAPELLERVLSNLMSNAIKYTRSGSVLLGARCAGDHVNLLVVDTGIGISPENISLIFQDFFQIANRERNSIKGFGLGLGIVRRLCEGMDWKLNVRSVVGRGSVFSVTVPLTEKAKTPLPDIRDAVHSTAQSNSRMSVLFVDDDALVRDAMRRLLADWDFPATLCETGTEAMAVLSESDPSSRWHVVLDFRLAGDEDGLALADRIRARFGERVRITLMSGEANPDLQQGAERRGIVLLRKPVKPIRLRAMLTSE
jgi:two-component system, sensor histidine kinase